MAAQPTFANLCKIVPRLRQLHDLAASVRDDKRQESFCANYLWYGALKPQLERLVGWNARWEPLPDEPRRTVFLRASEVRRKPQWEVEPMYGLPEEVELVTSSAAYSVAYQTVWEALPDCRNCGCA
jgi:hypothetical protein